MSDDIKLPEPAGWVNVYDRMPDSDAEVLVYVPSNEPARVRIDSWSMRREAPWSLSSTTVETGFAWGNFEFEEVTHWMPMLAAPQDFAMFTADQLRAAVMADREERASAAEQVCYEAYQVVGSMLDDLGQFNTEQARKVLDNLSQAKKVHDDVLPWPSFRVQDAPSDAIRKGRRCVDRLDGYYDFECEGGPLRMNVEWDMLKRAFEHLCLHIERAHGIVEKDSNHE